MEVREKGVEIVLRPTEGLALPGGRVEDDLAVAERDAGVDQALPHALALRVVEELAVDARVALFDDGAAVDAVELVCALVHLVGHERVGGQQVVGLHEVADDVGRRQRAVLDVVAHALERGAVPGVQIDLAGALGEVVGEGGVVDEVLAGGQRAVVGRRAVADEGHARIVGELLHGGAVPVQVGQRPDVGEVLQVGRGEQLAEQRLRVVEHPVAGERLVEDRAEDERLPTPVRVDLEASGALHSGREALQAGKSHRGRVYESGITVC